MGVSNGSAIGKKLRQLRQESGLSLAKVSNDTGIGRTALQNYEAGIRIPRDEAKAILASYYGKTIDFLFFT